MVKEEKIMADLFIPIVIIILMYLIISCVDDGLTLLAIGFLFTPISFIFAQMVNAGQYTMLFGGTIPANTISIGLIGGIMFTIPLFAVGKILYIRREMNKGKVNENE